MLSLMKKSPNTEKKLIFRKDEPKLFENFQDQIRRNSEPFPANDFWVKYAKVILYLVVALILAPFIFHTTKSVMDIVYLFGIFSAELIPRRWKRQLLLVASAGCAYCFFNWVYRIFQWKNSGMQPPITYLQMTLCASVFFIFAVSAGVMSFKLANKRSFEDQMGAL